MRKIVAYSRRTFLARSAAITGVAGLSAVLAACGGSSGESADTSGESAASPPTADTSAPSEPAVAPETDPTATPSTNGTAPATQPQPPAGDALDTNQELAVSFSYVVDESSGSGGGGRGRIRNPYVAVWIEDADGNAVRTIDLSFQQDRKGKKWLDDLKRWYRQDQARVESGGVEIVDTVSSATRKPGDYSVTWDMKNEAGVVQPKGAYFVCVEASREHGPYGIVRETFVLDGTPFNTTLAGEEELQNVVVELRAV